MNIGLIIASLATAAPISGIVRQHGSGKVLPEIVVRVDADGQNAETNDNGVFTVDLDPGTHRLWFDSIDHQLLGIEFEVPLTTPLEVFLVEHLSGDIIVESFRQTAHITRHVVDAEMALETPGTLEDSVRLVQSLPGVSVRREFSKGQADLSVRGSSPGDNRYMLDGIDVPYLYHFNQYASVFPTTQLDTLELFPSTFGAAYGDAIGGVIDARSVRTRPDAVHGSVSLSTAMGSVSIQAPIPNTDWWVAASGRRSYQDLFTQSTDQFTIWPVFGDFSLRAGRDRKDGHLQVFAWGADDRYERAAGELDLLDVAEASETPSFLFQRGFQVFGVQWSDRKPRGQSTHVLGAVRDQIEASLTNNGSQRLLTGSLHQRSLFEHNISDQVHIEGGWYTRLEQTGLWVDNPGDDVILIAQEAPALGRGVAVERHQFRAQVSAFAELHYVAGNLRVMPGIRIPVDTMSPGLLPEPRLALRWRAAEQTALKLAAGYYQQSPETQQMLAGTGNPDLGPTDAWQVAAGIEQTIAQRLEFNVDGYFKSINAPVIQPLGRTPFAGHSGTAFGVELVARYRMRETFFIWGWLAYARALVTTEADSTPQPTEADQPLSAGIVASWNPGKGWNLGLRYRYGSGLPYTPINGSVYNGSKDTWVPILGATNSARFPNYHKVDLHIEKAWEFKRWTLSTYIEGWFVPEPSTQLYPTWNYNYREQGWVVGPTFLPLLGARATF